MGGSSSGGGTQTVRSEPWGPTQAPLKNIAIPAARRAYGNDLWDRAGDIRTSRPTGRAEDMMMGAARSASNLTQDARQSLRGFMDGDVYRDLDAVRSNALGAAMPAAMAQFDMSGMGNSSLMADAAGRAAAEAIAPIEYGAWNEAQNRGLRATALAPSIGQMGMLGPGMMGQVGAARDARLMANSPAAGQLRDLTGYGGLLSQLGGLGGSQQVPGEPGTSPFGALAGGLSTGLGAYGALAAPAVGLGGPVGAGLAGGLGLLTALGAL